MHHQKSAANTFALAALIHYNTNSSITEYGNGSGDGTIQERGDLAA